MVVHHALPIALSNGFVLLYLLYHGRFLFLLLAQIGFLSRSLATTDIGNRYTVRAWSKGYRSIVSPQAKWPHDNPDCPRRGLRAPDLVPETGKRMD